MSIVTEYAALKVYFSFLPLALHVFSGAEPLMPFLTKDIMKNICLKLFPIWGCFTLGDDDILNFYSICGTNCQFDQPSGTLCAILEEDNIRNS